MTSINKSLTMVIISSCMSLPFAEVAEARTTYWEQRVTLFDELPVKSGDIVFLGNSITDGGEFYEFLGKDNVKNRGISGDVVSGVKERLNQVTNGNPDKIFLLIGINDLAHGLSAEQVAEEYESLVKDILAKSPSTKLYIQSVMPIDSRFDRFKSLNGKEKDVAELNTRLKKIAADNNVIFIDLFSLLVDNDGRLKNEYTNDGLHLLGAGYRVWIDHIKKYVEE